MIHNSYNVINTSYNNDTVWTSQKFIPVIFMYSYSQKSINYINGLLDLGKLAVDMEMPPDQGISLPAACMHATCITLFL